MNTSLKVPSPVEIEKMRLTWGCMTRPKIGGQSENGPKKPFDVGVRDVRRKTDRTCVNAKLDLTLFR